MLTRSKTTETVKNKRHCIYCDELIFDHEEFKLTINRSMGYGLVGLSHVMCIPEEGGDDEALRLSNGNSK